MTKITLIGPGPKTTDYEDGLTENTVSYTYDAMDLACFSDMFMKEIINGNTEINLTKHCRPEEFHAFNVLLRDKPENRFDYTVEAIELLLKTGSKVY